MNKSRTNKLIDPWKARIIIEANYFELSMPERISRMVIPTVLAIFGSIITVTLILLTGNFYFMILLFVFIFVIIMIDWLIHLRLIKKHNLTSEKKKVVINLDTVYHRKVSFEEKWNTNGMFYLMLGLGFFFTILSIFSIITGDEDISEFLMFLIFGIVLIVMPLLVLSAGQNVMIGPESFVPPIVPLMWVLKRRKAEIKYKEIHHVNIASVEKPPNSSNLHITSLDIFLKDGNRISVGMMKEELDMLIKYLVRRNKFGFDKH